MTLDDLVEQANELLPRYLPHEARGELNARLVRHLATLGLLDEAGRAGREARYAPRHLLQLLTVRRLMAEGLTTGALQTLLHGASDERLQRLLEGGARAAFESEAHENEADEFSESSRSYKRAAKSEKAPESSNGALDFLLKVKARTEPKLASPRVLASRAMPKPQARASPVTKAAHKVARWTRWEITPGLELFVEDNFRAPTTAHERDVLLEKAWAALRAAGEKL